ncbi:hypothetical protein VTH8203_04107 [Vibrio thalassae]|uniref:DUF2956 domain-containing protein n=1 Tax=Vibrio thalassae TaxID=1243014 RepID=A0A240EP18_9VIBR|nr:DUF2956 family protein [Vibrio thalassae]SNX50447.1 hypothetical protein VTH8203_04107 [Vibrio thalassae]
MKTNKATPSLETQQEAMRIAKSTQKPGQTKEQTKLIAQGIEKGIAQYKKQQKDKKRQADKAQKKQKKDKQQQRENNDSQEHTLDMKTQHSEPARLPWLLLILSWIGFIAYVVLK